MTQADQPRGDDRVVVEEDFVMVPYVAPLSTGLRFPAGAVALLVVAAMVLIGSVVVAGVSRSDGCATNPDCAASLPYVGLAVLMGVFLAGMMSVGAVVWASSTWRKAVAQERREAALARVMREARGQEPPAS